MKQLFKSVTVLVLLGTISHLAVAQTFQQEIATLKASLPEKKGGDKVLFLKDIAMKFRSVNVDSAKFYTDMAFKEAESINSDYYKARIWVTYGIFSHDASKPKEALAYYLKAQPILEVSEEYYALGSLYTGISNAYEVLTELDKSVEYQFKALDNFIKAKDSLWIAGSYLNLGNRYRLIAEPDLSLKYYLKALEIYQKLGNNYYIAVSYNCISAAYLDKKQFDKTFEFAKKSLEGYEAIGARLDKAYPLTNMALSSWKAGKLEDAEQYYVQAIEIQKERGDRFSIFHLKNDLSNILLEQGNIQEAEKLALATFKEAEQINYIPAIDVLSSALSLIYEKKKDYPKANAYLKKFITARDSLYLSEKAKEMLNLKEKYEAAEKEKQILQQKAEITDHQLALKNRSFWIFGLVALAIIIGLIGFLLYKQQVLRNIQQQKDNDLKLALEKIESQNHLQEQRLAISRDLHDNIGAQLSFIVSAIDTIKYYIADKNEKLTGKLDNIGAFAKETIQELRDTIWAMNKAGITLADLQSRIANFIEKAKQSQLKTHIAVVVDESIPTDLKFTALQGLNIFRIIQEATSNALKYAEASHVNILVSKEGNGIRFTVRDDGSGFVENEVEAGNGLQNMRKRAGELGSELELLPVLGEETTVTFKVGLPI